MLEKILGEVKGTFNIITLIELCTSLIYIIVGLIFFTNPYMSDVLVSIIAGIMLIINGGIEIFSFIKKDGVDLYDYNIIYGILLVIIGIVVLFFKNILSILLGIYFLVSGIQKGNYALILKKFKESSWLLVLVMGICFIVIGVLSLFTNSDYAVKVCGICLLGYGLINAINIMLLRHRAKYFLD